MKLIIYGLGGLSALFIGRSALEMYVWTPLRGSQMVFFSLAHTWPTWAVYIFFVSWFAYFGLLAALMLTLGAACMERLLGSATLTTPNVEPSAVHQPKSRRSWQRHLLHALAWPRDTRSFGVLAVSLTLLLIHWAAMFTYQHWSTVFDRPGS